MNERIKELATESALLTKNGGPRYCGEEQDIEKFAQLIVQECANQCTYDGPFTAEVVWGKQFREKILKNFGIEE